MQRWENLDVGQIMVIASENIEDKYHELIGMPGNRAIRQNAYALWCTPELDLKSNEFEAEFKPQWFKFKLTEADKIKYTNPDMLNPSGDKVAAGILLWYECWIKNNNAITPDVKTYLAKKMEGLADK